MPVRSTIHSSEVSTCCASSSFVTTRSGTLQPSPVIEIAAPCRAVPIIRPRRRSASPRTASSSPTSARPCPFAIGPRTRTNSHSSVSTSPGSTTRLNRQSSMPAKNGDLAAVRLVGENGDGTRLRDRLDREHARHHRPIRKVAGEPPVVGANLSSRRRRACPGSSSTISSTSRNGGTVRDQLLDHLPAERGRRDAHATSRPRAARASGSVRGARGTSRSRRACRPPRRSPRTSSRARPSGRSPAPGVERCPRASRRARRRSSDIPAARTGSPLGPARIVVVERLVRPRGATLARRRGTC